MWTTRTLTAGLGTLAALALCSTPVLAQKKDKPDEEPLSVAIFPLRAKGGAIPDNAELVTHMIVEEMRTHSTFSGVLSPTEVGVRLSPKEQEQLMDCASDRCAMMDTELAGALGATHMLVGALFKVDEGHMISLKVLDLRSALEMGSVTKNVLGTTQGMLNGSKGALTEMLKESKVYRAKAAVAPPPPMPLPPPRPRPVEPPPVVVVQPPPPAPEPAPATVTTLMAEPDLPNRPAPLAEEMSPPAAGPPLWAPAVLGGGIASWIVGAIGVVASAWVGILATGLLLDVFLVPWVNLQIKPIRIPRFRHGSREEGWAVGTGAGMLTTTTLAAPIVLGLFVAGAVAISAGGFTTARE